MRIVVLGVVSLALFLSGCGREEAPQESLSEAEQMMQAGRQKARACMSCHGPAGISRVASYPSLAGLPEDYLSEQMRAFRSGLRDNVMMVSVARNLSDEDITLLSHYYHNLPGAESAQ